MTNIRDLAKKYATDKSELEHNYVAVYDRYFDGIKDDVKKVLEIGILDGASLKMWRDYFPKADVYGVDVYDKSYLNSDRIFTSVVDQSDRNQLDLFIGKVGYNFDIIIDDGSHIVDHQQISFGCLFCSLKSKGIYVIEDLHTSLKGGEYNPTNTERTTLKVLGDFSSCGKLNSEFFLPEEIEYIESAYGYCNIEKGNFAEICFVGSK